MYPWHQIQPPQTKRRVTPVPVLGPLPREWRWGPDLLPVLLSWLSELQWLDLPPAEERHPRAHWQVSFMELTIDFEAYAGRQLPPAPQSRFQGGDMSLQEKARVMRLITRLLGRSVGKESILPAKLTNSCKSLIPMGVGAVMGLEGRPLLTKPPDIWKHLQRLRKYGEDRWAQRRRQRQAKHRAKRDKQQARNAEHPRPQAGNGPRCPAKGGAKADHFAADFYARPAGRPKESFHVDDGAQAAAVQGLTRLAMAFTPLRTEARARRAKAHKRRTKTWICETHRHPPVQGMRDHTPGGQALLLSGTSGAPTSAHGVPSGRKPHPSTRTGGPTSQSTDPDGQGGGRAAHPRPQTACAAHADEWGPTPGGVEGPRRGRSRPVGGQKTAGTRTPPPRE